QADSSTTRRFGGTGLGLALCQQLTRLLGGEVTCSSVLDEGSTFSVVVATGPLDGVRMLTSLLAESRQRRDAKAVPPRLPHELRDRRILLADDAPDNQRLVAFLLRKAGAEVEIVGDGQMAADRILGELHQRRPFDLVVMDMQMPLMDGYAATSLVRERGFRGPIVALTAHAMSGDREMCLQAGCTEYLAKPIDHAQLIAVVAALVASAPAPSPAGP
ncbi:MAG TPA: response regulator, partial [Planctomycetota bacterium]|nr:response regulator [Planctomycetota bacterium]